MTVSIFWKDDPAYLLNATMLNKMFQEEKTSYLSGNSGGTGVSIESETILKLKSGSFYKAYMVTAAEDITTLDTGALTIGNDYYVYLCDNASDTGIFLISLSGTAPSGYTVSNSVCIGGFHYGRVRKVNSAGFPLDSGTTVYGDGWETEVTTEVTPNSVWDDINRPICDPQGMVKVGKIWIDIYQASEDDSISISNLKLASGTSQSAYSESPITGDDDINYYTANELAVKTGKRLLLTAEWLHGAEGSPEGKDSNSMATTNSGNSAFFPTGSVTNAVSANNLCDCVGNVWEIVEDSMVKRDEEDPTFTEVESGIDSSIFSLARITDSICLAGTYNDGKIFRSTDSGLNWVEIYDHATETHIHSIARITDSICLAGTRNDGTILRSTDSGLTWTEVYDHATETQILSLARVTDSICLAGTGLSGTILRSTDSGLNWTEVYNGATETYINCIAKITDSILLAGTGNNGTILRSTDAGVNWTEIYNDSTASAIFCITRMTDLICLAGTGDDGTILRSIDAGLTWTEVYNDISEIQMLSIARMSDSVCIIGTGNGGTILRSTDSGATWEEIYDDSTETQILSIVMLSDCICLAGTSPNGNILRSTNICGYNLGWKENECGSGTGQQYDYLTNGQLTKIMGGAWDSEHRAGSRSNNIISKNKTDTQVGVRFCCDSK